MKKVFNIINKNIAIIYIRYVIISEEIHFLYEIIEKLEGNTLYYY